MQMDSFNVSNIKVEKANALKKHRQLQKIANMFRLVEICLVLALISRFTIQLPVAVKNSSDYFKDLTVTLVSPRFVFVIGNVIVITLFAKSGQFSGQDSGVKNSRTDLYEEFVEKSEKGQRYEVAYSQKESTQVGFKVTTDQDSCVALETNPTCEMSQSENLDACVALEKKSYERSQSENLSRPKCNKSCLRRTATEISKKGSGSGEGLLVKKTYPEDKMSNEEFRCTIEAFIARQKQFRKDEENSYLLE
ncbi:hypothetical protein Tsubulata_037132 [Turnera subulata]|uniref:DUF4408 domain-containing protein n=1 Tax=Turnera subulata TaxID=218843 RepID=A0A9Q0JP10_9ROSI|nr:hypothetical protein Tsubulata_037132 [Turnera subulata]